MTQLNQLIQRLSDAEIGVLWALWHAPLLLRHDSPMSTYPVMPWAAALVAQSFLLTWLYNRSSGSVIITSLFHVAVNVWTVVLGVTSFVSLAALYSLAAFAVFRSGGLEVRTGSAQR